MVRFQVSYAVPVGIQDNVSQIPSDRPPVRHFLFAYVDFPGLRIVRFRSDCLDVPHGFLCFLTVMPMRRRRSSLCWT